MAPRKKDEKGNILRKSTGLTKAQAKMRTCAARLACNHETVTIDSRVGAAPRLHLMAVDAELAFSLQDARRGNLPAQAVDIPTDRETIDYFSKFVLTADSSSVHLFILLKEPHARHEYVRLRTLGISQTVAVRRSIASARPFTQPRRLWSHHGPKAVMKWILPHHHQLSRASLRPLVPLIRAGKATVRQVIDAQCTVAQSLCRTSIPFLNDKTGLFFGQKAGYYAHWSALRILLVAGTQCRIEPHTTWAQIICGTGYLSGYAMSRDECAIVGDSTTAAGRRLTELQKHNPYEWFKSHGLLTMNLLLVSAILCLETE